MRSGSYETHFYSMLWKLESHMSTRDRKTKQNLSRSWCFKQEKKNQFRDISVNKPRGLSLITQSDFSLRIGG